MPPRPDATKPLRYRRSPSPGTRVGAGRALLPSPAMELGTRVEVRSRFDDRWSRGFEVAEVVDEGGRARYRLKRRSDGSLLPTLFVDDEVREEKKRSMWWIA